MTEPSEDKPHSNCDIGGISAQNPVVARPYAVGLFDVLGFKDRFERMGLMEMMARYRALIDIVVQRDKGQVEAAQFFSSWKEGPYWCRDGQIFLMTEVSAAYGSDSFMVWAHYTWTDLHQTPKEELDALSKDSRYDWLFCPVPCDAFLNVCNELMCRSLQVGLPLRGALSVGDAVMDKKRNIFLGQPVIEASVLEHGQNFIGASMSRSFVEQTVPKRYCLPFNQHLKNPSMEASSGLVLDWPRHWRNSRGVDAKEVVRSMDTNKKFSGYYQNTLDSIDLSEKLAQEHKAEDTCPIRSNYEQFSYSRGGDIAGYAVGTRLTPVTQPAP